MDASNHAADEHAVPVLLLKTRSTPGDSYEDTLSAASLHDGRSLSPRFIPVLRHSFHEDGLDTVKKLLRNRQISRDPHASYGGIIFTSQRAVEAFAHVCGSEGKDIGDANWPHLQDVPIYSVGPATSRALSAVSQTPALQIFGEHTGNGEALAKFMLSHYGDWYRDRATKPPLLFLVGEQRRDVIPRMLMDPTLPSHAQIQVTEEVVYGTGEMESFPTLFTDALRDSEARRTQWVVVFSPTGCDSMLRCLDMLDDETGKVVPGRRDAKTSIATIGPTTRDFLINTFGFEPDVCADKPSPDGVLQAIVDFERNRVQ